MAKQVSLEILRILEEETDKEHMLSKEEILERLGERFETYIGEGAFYRKIDELEEAGYKLIHTRGRTTKYCLDVPRLQKDELLYLSMMILGSPELSAAEASRMVQSLTDMPVHKCARKRFVSYQKTLENANSPTNQIEKFAILLSALEQGRAVTCKCVWREGEEYRFSEMKTLYPKQFRFDGKESVFECLENGETFSYFLHELINVELV